MIDCSKTTNYLSERRRMTKQQAVGVCKLNCANCPLSEKNNDMDISCSTLEILYPEKTVAIVQKWSDEHPQRTYLTEFLKHYPNVQLYDTGIPKGICPYHLGLMSKDDCDNNCIECWNKCVEDGESK